MSNHSIIMLIFCIICNIENDEFASMVIDSGLNNFKNFD